ncbi:hypothetical protein O181_079100 [Austropuccinia psidii MF-1]|uniref:Uncharacterized protein n=1 Tax=Austropuccinia psidii MF-1 TaxID=1389203 RepID=A0A9Q3FE53_9BASI|nr:hypothetical protein [Austropuccinia psidii MF-1]
MKKIQAFLNAPQRVLKDPGNLASNTPNQPSGTPKASFKRAFIWPFRVLNPPLYHSQYWSRAPRNPPGHPQAANKAYGLKIWAQFLELAPQDPNQGHWPRGSGQVG